MTQKPSRTTNTKLPSSRTIWTAPGLIAFCLGLNACASTAYYRGNYIADKDPTFVFEHADTWVPALRQGGASPEEAVEVLSTAARHAPGSAIENADLWLPALRKGGVSSKNAYKVMAIALQRAPYEVLCFLQQWEPVAREAGDSSQVPELLVAAAQLDAWGAVACAASWTRWVDKPLAYEILDKATLMIMSFNLPQQVVQFTLVDYLGRPREVVEMPLSKYDGGHAPDLLLLFRSWVPILLESGQSNTTIALVVNGAIRAARLQSRVKPTENLYATALAVELAKEDLGLPVGKH